LRLIFESLQAIVMAEELVLAVREDLEGAQAEPPALKSIKPSHSQRSAGAVNI
jgi:hypothetical protein